jgi:hypothetical protein
MQAIEAGAEEPASDQSPEQLSERSSEQSSEQSSGPSQEPSSEQPPKRRILKRVGPQPLTPEEQEEARRLSEIAASQGTDPTALVGRFQALFQNTTLTGGSKASMVVERVDIAFRGNWLLRVDVPQLWTDTNIPGVENQMGLGDLLVKTGGRVYAASGYAVFAGMDFNFPTADEPLLGTGKYSLGPAIATARVFPGIRSFLFGSFQHEFSVGGDPSRQNVSISHLSATWNTVWSERWWTQVAPNFNLDWEQNRKTSMVMEFEGGYSMTRLWRVWARPGVGVWGQDAAYGWKMQFGVRRMFAGF